MTKSFEKLQHALEELHIAEEELRQQNEELAAARLVAESERQRYQELFDFAPYGYLVTDAAGTIQEANRAVATLLSVPQDFLVGKPLVGFVTEENRKAFHIQLTRLTESQRLEDWEVYLQPREGKPFPAAITTSIIHNQVGKLVGLRWLIRDITERKQAEKGAMADLERSNKELEQFASVASHDLQEPLRMVASYTQLLAKRYQDKLDADANEFIGYAVDGANRMQKMINDLLSYSRVGTRGKLFETVDCTAIFNQSLNNLKMAIEETGAVITHDPLPTMMGDESQLVQLFQNLIDNAIKFRGKETPHIHISATHESRKTMDDGRETIDQLRTARLSSPKSQLSELKEGWVFSVRDNGIGIDPQDKERIFTIFQRLHGRDYSGTGIGLSICKRIIERHGGKIWVESEPEEGSTFYFTIPDR